MSSAKIFNTLTPSSWSFASLVEDTYREKRYWESCITNSLNNIGTKSSFTSDVSNGSAALIYTVGILPLYIPVLNLITYLAYSVLFQFNLNQQYVNALNSGNITGAFVCGQRGADLKLTDKEKNTLLDLFCQNLLSKSDPSIEDYRMAKELFEWKIPLESLSLKPKKDAASKSPPSFSGTLPAHSIDMSNTVLDPFSYLLIEEKNIQEIFTCLRNNSLPLVITDSGAQIKALLDLLTKKITDFDAPPSVAGRRVIYIDMKQLSNAINMEYFLKEEREKIRKNQNNVVLVLDNFFDCPNRYLPNFGDQFLNGLTVPYILMGTDKSHDKQKRCKPIQIEKKGGSKDEAHLLLNEAKNLFESHFSLEIEDEAITCAVESSSKYFRANSPIEIGIELLKSGYEKFQSQLKNGSPTLLAKKEELKKLIIKQNVAKLNGSDPQVVDTCANQITQLQEEVSKLEKSEATYKILCTQYRSLQLIQKTLQHLAKKYFPNDPSLESLLDKNRNAMQELRKAPELQQVTLDKDLINQAIGEKAKIPTAHLQAKKSEEKGSTLESRLNEEIIGQEEAIKVVCDAITAAEIGLKPENRPVGVFMCVGPTGVGKTTLAKLLGKEYMGDEKNLIRLDMTDYQEKHSVSNLQGSPKGYVNHEESAYWIKKIQENSRSVILIDEIEKAHPDILLFFLKIFDEGFVTDNKGNRVDCSEALFIITSNAGSREILSFGKPKPSSLWDYWSKNEEKEETLKTVIMRAIRNHPHFKPEFLNRIDEIIIFNRLEDPKIIKKIVEKELHAFASLVHRTQNITLKWTDKLISLLAVKGFDPVMGARPLKRVIEKEIRGLCIQALKDKTLSKGCTALLTVSKDGEKFMVKKVAE